MVGLWGLWIVFVFFLWEEFSFYTSVPYGVHLLWGECSILQEKLLDSSLTSPWHPYILPIKTFGSVHFFISAMDWVEKAKVVVCSDAAQVMSCCHRIYG